jgi:hypothetical protein
MKIAIFGADGPTGRLLADCLRAQVADRTWVDRAVAIATVAVTPGIVQLVWREGIRKKG